MGKGPLHPLSLKSLVQGYGRLSRLSLVCTKNYFILDNARLEFVSWADENKITTHNK